MKKSEASNQKSEIRRQAQRACATVAEVLGRDPKAKVRTGADGLIAVPTKDIRPKTQD